MDAGGEMDEAECSMFSLTELNLSDMQSPAAGERDSCDLPHLKRSRRRRDEAESGGLAEKRHCTDIDEFKLCALMKIPMLRSPGMLRSPSPSGSSSAISGPQATLNWPDDSSSENCGNATMPLRPQSHPRLALGTSIGPSTDGVDSEAESAEQITELAVTNCTAVPTMCSAQVTGRQSVLSEKRMCTDIVGRSGVSEKRTFRGCFQKRLGTKRRTGDSKSDAESEPDGSKQQLLSSVLCEAARWEPGREPERGLESPQGMDSDTARVSPCGIWARVRECGEEHATASDQSAAHNEQLVSLLAGLDEDCDGPAEHGCEVHGCEESTEPLRWHFKPVLAVRDELRDQLDVLKGADELLLHEAIKAGFFSLADHLVDSGCPLDVVDTDSNTALQLACEASCVWLVQKIVVAAWWADPCSRTLDRCALDGIIQQMMAATNHQHQMCHNTQIELAMQKLTSTLPRWSMALHHVFPYELRRRTTAAVLCASYESSSIWAAHHNASLFDLLFTALFEISMIEGLPRQKGWRSGRSVGLPCDCDASSDD